MSTATRRGILCLGAAAPLAALAPIAPGLPDAVHVALGAEHARLTAALAPLEAAFFAASSDDGAELQRLSGTMQPLNRRLDAIADELVEMPAVSLAGWQAKAAALRHQMMIFAHRGVLNPADLEPAERLAWELAGDLLAAGDGA